MGYKTMQGKEIDFERLMRENELMPAIGNMKVNARGDELGPGGQIKRTRESIVADYYENNPKAAPTVQAQSIIQPTPPVVVVEQPVVQKQVKKPQQEV